MPLKVRLQGGPRDGERLIIPISLREVLGEEAAKQELTLSADILAMPSRTKKRYHVYERRHDEDTEGYELYAYVGLSDPETM